jgi:hypothetical protein
VDNANTPPDPDSYESGLVLGILLSRFVALRSSGPTDPVFTSPVPSEVPEVIRTLLTCVCQFPAVRDGLAQSGSLITCRVPRRIANCPPRRFGRPAPVAGRYSATAATQWKLHKDLRAPWDAPRP